MQFKAEHGRLAVLVIDGAEFLTGSEAFVRRLVLRAKVRSDVAFTACAARLRSAVTLKPPPSPPARRGRTRSACVWCSCPAPGALWS